MAQRSFIERSMALCLFSAACFVSETQAQERFLNRKRIDALEARLEASDLVDQQLVETAEQLHRRLGVREQELVYLQQKLDRLLGDVDLLRQEISRKADKPPPRTSVRPGERILGIYTPNATDEIEVGVSQGGVHLRGVQLDRYTRFEGNFERNGGGATYRGVLTVGFRANFTLRVDQGATLEMIGDRLCLTTSLPLDSPILLTLPDGRRKISLVRL